MPPRSYLPPGWPAAVHPPDTEDFVGTAVGWLFDQSPPDFRLYDVLRRHPVLLARLAREQLAASVQACRAGYRTARADLAAAFGVDTLDAMLATYEREGRRLAAAVRAAELVEAALRGERFAAPL